MIFQRLPTGTHYLFFKLNHRWPCSKFDHGQCCVTFQYGDLYNTGKKITSSGCECERNFFFFFFFFLTCVSRSFFIPVNLIRSFQKQKMIYFVHNYFHLVIFHRLFDHLVQWITLDITKRRYSEHIWPVPWPFVIQPEIMPSPYYPFMSLTGRRHDTFLCRITYKKARIWTFF